jgi:hypothetical protein
MANLPLFLVDYSCFNAPEECRQDWLKSQEDAWNWKVRGGRTVTEGAEGRCWLLLRAVGVALA